MDKEGGEKMKNSFVSDVAVLIVIIVAQNWEACRKSCDMTEEIMSNY